MVELENVQELLAECLAGRQDAWCRLVNHYTPRLLRIAQALTHNSQDARDLLQDTFLKFFTSLDGSKTILNPTVYLDSILRHCAVDAYRRSCVRPSTVTLMAEPASDDDCVIMVLRDAIRSFESPRREVLVRHFDGQSALEIVDAMQIPESSVYKHIQAGKDRLNAMFSRGDDCVE